jgi:hypothetical protein
LYSRVVEEVVVGVGVVKEDYFEVQLFLLEEISLERVKCNQCSVEDPPPPPPQFNF